MDVVCADTRLNISKAYLKPGYAFGGSCLPKDLRALRSFGRAHNTPTPLLDATMTGNDYQIEKAYKLIRKTGKRKVGLLGITFKSDTDDLRESPYLALAERLLGSGYDLSIYDQNISSTEDGGRSFVAHLAPYIRTTAGEVLNAADTIVIGNKDDEHSSAFQSYEGKNGAKVVVDLARLPDAKREGIEYIGLSW